jgi:membrane protein involved in colicin uptake
LLQKKVPKEETEEERMARLEAELAAAHEAARRREEAARKKVLERQMREQVKALPYATNTHRR